jgi:chaperonin cofactor prefoldin
MDLAELDAGFDPNAQQLSKGIYIQFFLHTDKDDKRTREEGRPCFKDYEYVRITVAGDRNNIVERPVTAMDRMRFAAQYKAFKENRELPQEGYPLAEWPGINKAMVEELAYFKVRTVEQLAAISDVQAQNIFGVYELRKKAIAYLEKMKEDAPMEKINEMVAQKDEQIRQLTESLEALVAKVKTLESKKNA